MEQTYSLIKKDVPQVEIDSLDVVKKVEEHRRFWKPKKTNVILLAESHVYTDQKDFEIWTSQSYLQKFPIGYPSRFVRFVYCVGYGETEILTKKPKRTNSGTPQYWKIFSSCVAKNKYDLGLDRVLKSRRIRSRSLRLQNKLNILYQMKTKGIWLLDASIVGLYGNQAKKSLEDYQKIIEICWDNYLKQVITEVSPKFIIVIGKQVENSLFSRLNELNIPYETLYQPQARLTKQEHFRNFQQLNKICNKIIRSEKIVLKKPLKKKPVLRSINFSNSKTVFDTLTPKLRSLGYTKNTRTEWQKQNKIIHILRSKEFGRSMRITWKEQWKNDHAIIFDYSKVNGPTCIVPIPELFSTEFVKNKRQQQSYVNSGYWWTQNFSLDKPLAQHIISFKDNWDYL
ncbi:MAG: hypothetical protein ACOWW1_06385 [archaeon]